MSSEVKRGSAAEQAFEEWLGTETCEVHWDESAEKNARYGWQAGIAYALSVPPRWIAVSERLPELSVYGAPQMVLMAVVGRELPEMGWKLADECKWQSVETEPCDMPIYFDMDQITHWMPLPQSPKGAK